MTEDCRGQRTADDRGLQRTEDCRGQRTAEDRGLQWTEDCRGQRTAEDRGQRTEDMRGHRYIFPKTNLPEMKKSPELHITSSYYRQIIFILISNI
jgi:hypothetical protein